MILRPILFHDPVPCWIRFKQKDAPLVVVVDSTFVTVSDIGVSHPWSSFFTADNAALLRVITPLRNPGLVPVSHPCPPLQGWFNADRTVRERSAAATALCISSSLARTPTRLPEPVKVDIDM